MRRAVNLWSAVIGLSLVASAIGADEKILAPSAVPTKLLNHGAGEGPVWHPKLGLLFSGDGHIGQLTRDGQQKLYREGAGTNGLLFDPQGRLVACEHSARRVTRTDTTGKLTVLTDQYEGKKYNSPNDLTLDSKGRIYFTDPRYGDRSSIEMKDSSGREIEGVYRIDLDGKVTRIIDTELQRPNGLTITPDDRHLFVADNHNNKAGASRKLYRFDLKSDGSIVPESRKQIFDWGNGRGPDGMELDQQGRLFVAGGLNQPQPPFETNERKGGVYVLSQEGALLEFIPIPNDEVTNVAFGGDDLRTLFVTAGGTLWSVRVNVPGRSLFPATKPESGAN